MLKNRFLGLIFLFFILLEVKPFIQGYLAGLSINSQVWNIPTALVSPRTFPAVGLDGSTFHSLFYEFDGAVTIDVEVGVRKTDGTFIWATPTGVGPFSGAGPSVESLNIPVATHIRFIVTGAGVTGSLAFNES